MRVERLGPYRVSRPDPRTADVITAIDGTPVRNADELLAKVEEHPPGEVARVRVLRNGRELEVEVRLGEAP
jgi:S1-C subfamily serine protease